MPHANPDLHEILYCSNLATGLSPAVVGTIVAHARVRNAQRGVTGLLVFDGYRFCHHFEGPRDTTVRLMDRISDDPRHTDVRVVYEGPLEQRRYPRFEMGLADADLNFPDLEGLDGNEALARFLQLRPGYDVS
ncbi:MULTISPECIES: BLUF domain-containing protein [unclassified Variovorax]|uniref:BLUF domain-containing protein n=1 Tax=unclassified Variovorax TaxID=663243 RepID=UPI001BD37FB8|nr:MULTISPECIES: BLUF domain-containing protein [unclassified Variovorax]